MAENEEIDRLERRLKWEGAGAADGSFQPDDGPLLSAPRAGAVGARVRRRNDR